MEEVNQIAIERHGKLLSTDYVGAHSKLKWQCENKHIWEASLNHIKNDSSWCPHCKCGKGEKECLQLAEEIFSLSFKKERKYYDLSNKHKFYEFDGFNETHKIAIEYNGIQHYQYRERFHKQDVEALAKQQTRDKEKQKYCLDNSIRLIVIAYNEDIRFRLLEEYIKFVQQ